MKLTCPSCSADYEFDPHSIPSTGLSIKCYQCSHRFNVQPQQGQDSSLPTAESNNLSQNLFAEGGFGFDLNAPSDQQSAKTLPPSPARPQRSKQVKSSQSFVDLPKPVSSSLPKAFPQMPVAGFATPPPPPAKPKPNTSQVTS